MKSQFSAINLKDYFALVSVWELNGKCWRLLGIERTQKAIALCQKSPLRLVFPTGVNPTGLMGCVQCPAEQQEQEQIYQSSKAQKSIIALIRTFPGSSSKSLAEQLGISHAAVGRHLKKLEYSNKIYYCLDPKVSKKRLYYPATPQQKPELMQVSQLVGYR